MRNARVLISCGQLNDREIKIGKAVEEYFKTRNFETYFAEKVHSSDALTENIFKFLQNSEYFVFIDFKRDKLKENLCRGSLFVNQEIGIATFLNLEGIGFVEKGTKREGILDYHIHNAFAFEDGTEIITVLEKETTEWDNNSANEITIEYNPKNVSKNIELTNHPAKVLSNWYHLEVINRNKSKHAFSCLAYITKIIDLSNEKEIEVPSNELIWAGISDISANILGGSRKELDAFYVLQNENKILFHQRPLGTTNPRYRLPDLKFGIYVLEYTIISTNFENVSKRYVLNFEDSIENIKFQEQ